MKRLIVLSILLAGCQKPAAQAPVYNFTFTDQSSIIVGDNNRPVITPETDNNQRTESVATAETKKTTSHMWIFWLILISMLAAGAYYAYRRGRIKI